MKAGIVNSHLGASPLLLLRPQPGDVRWLSRHLAMAHRSRGTGRVMYTNTALLRDLCHSKESTGGVSHPILVPMASTLSGGSRSALLPYQKAAAYLVSLLVLMTTMH